ncbi:Protein kinase domain-containing protein [Plasmodiophora brassicae]
MDSNRRITDTTTPQEVAVVVRDLSQGRARLIGSFDGIVLRDVRRSYLHQYFVWDDEAPSEGRTAFIDNFYSCLHRPAPLPAVPFTCGSIAVVATDVASMYLAANPRRRGAPYKIVSVARAHSLAGYGVVHMAAFALAGLFDSHRRFSPLQLPMPDVLHEAAMPDRDFSFSASHILRPSHNSNLSVTIAYLLAALPLRTFVPSPLCRPELQFHGRVWDRVLDAALRVPESQSPSIFSHVEFALAQVLDGFPDQFVDYAVTLSATPVTGNDDPMRRARRLPILLAEIGAHDVMEDCDHKDFRKMAVDMAASLIAQLGVLREAPRDDRARLRVFGLLCGGGRAQPYVLVPDLADEGDRDKSDETVRASLVLHPLPSFDLFGNDVEQDPVPLVVPPGDLCNPDDVDQLDRNDRARYDGRSVRGPSARVFAEDGTVKLEYLRPLFTFADAVRQYAAEYDRLLDGHKADLSPPFPYPDEFGSPPRSRSSHALRSSARSSQRSSGTSSQRPPKRPRTRDVVEAEFDSSSGVSVCLLRRPDGSRVAVKRKPKSRQLEIDLLRAAQGPGVVRLVEDRGDAGIVLVEQRLDRIDLADLSLAGMAAVLIRLFVDGLDALQTMERAGIVHRDISVNNLMYSMEDRRWRLTDFDAACRATDLVDGGDGVLYGTDGFIAPEALAPERRYTFASDRWSLGACALYWINAAEDEYGRRRDVGHLFGALLGQLLVFAYHLQVGDRRLHDDEVQVLTEWKIERHLPGWPRNGEGTERPSGSVPVSSRTRDKESHLDGSPVR